MKTYTVRTAKRRIRMSLAWLNSIEGRTVQEAMTVYPHQTRRNGAHGRG